MGNSTTILSDVQTAATEAANGTNSAAQLQALGTQVNQDLDSLVQDANTQFEGDYLFSGTATNTAPIAVTRDAQGNIQEITYQGSDTEVTYPVEPGPLVAGERNRPGGLHERADGGEAAPGRLEQHAGTQQPGAGDGVEQ